MSGRTLRYTDVRGTMVIVHARTLPDDGEWDGLMRRGAELGPQMQRVLVFADTAISAAQRRQIADVIKSAQTQKVVVVTSSQVTRMIVTGLGWITGIHKAFDGAELEAAFAALQLPESDVRELLRSAYDFAVALDHDSLVRTLAGHPLLSKPPNQTHNIAP